MVAAGIGRVDSGVIGETDDDLGAASARVATADPHAQAAQAPREKFLPVTRSALMDRLTAAHLWPQDEAIQARRFLRYLDYWRRHSYAVKLLELEQAYEPFSPDTDLLKTRLYSAEERAVMQK